MCRMRFDYRRMHERNLELQNEIDKLKLRLDQMDLGTLRAKRSCQYCGNSQTSTGGINAEDAGNRNCH